MKKIKFKSLAMRIWATFVVINLIIIFSISFLYLVAFRMIGENSKIQNLKFAHDVLLQSSNLGQSKNFEDLSSLKGTDHFIVRINSNNKYEISDILKKNIEPPQSEKNNMPPPMGADPETKNWMATFIVGNSIYENEFKEYHNNRKFIFLISSIKSTSTDRTYLISYMPEMQDNLLIYILIVTGIVFIAIGFFTAKIVANYISKPLNELGDYAVKVGNKEWTEPLEVKSKDEIGRLVESMNHMQKELKRSDEEEKMFLQSISHDLKTPVMVIMSHAEAIIDGMYIESVEKTAEIIKEEAVSLEKKIKQLLYLNTLAYSLENNSEHVEFNLYDLMTSIVNRFEVINNKIKWNVNMENVQIQGNEEKIQVAIENILDNGLRYAKGEIKVNLKKEDEFIILDIYNDGPKISEKNINHIFENLYKDKTGNFGLGLAISKKIIDFYNGEIKAINRENGVSFIIKYPIN
ncbi:two-component system, OmpR family, sensor histidine kinase CssS [Clostridium cavendishii DSM 21758]|uniref:histidine kinase n=1 Tax=Clostridium cavendishii DSM 21758 TaxID=1121302 RepID=A0A1M6HXR9_9CLOT|nr:HAMP domain-containing sensor histidine kinase [Clostridium cavendishii]SHJ27011.1 two-component system, OmpR family, sensor histidine kinase CssS [Clostridium cavendishii DSM 21758]